MSRRLLLFACALVLLSALPVGLPALAQGTQSPRLITEFDVPGVIKLKFPSVAVNNGTVHVGATNNETTALYWNKAEAATAFGSAFTVGTANGQGDYSSASLFATSDGTLYYAWGSIEENRLKLRVRDPAGNWGPERLVFAGGSRDFPIFARVAVSQGRVFVIWLDIGKTVFGRVSTDGGASFSATFNASTQKTFSTPPAIAVGPSGQVALAFTSGDFKIYTSIWNGSQFVEEQATPFGFSNPSISYGPDGKLYVGYRGIERTGSLSGAWYSERQSPGVWTQQNLAGGYIEGAVNVVVDKANTRHFAWQAQPSGTPQIFYAFQPVGQSRSPALGGAAGVLFNPSLAVGDTGLAHIVAERFGGDDQTRLRYYLFEGKAPDPKPVALPKIENAARGTVPVIGKKPSVSVSFDGVANSPTQIRWRWQAAPSDTETDSGGWQTFANPITVPVRSDLATNCSELRLYTQVRTATVLGDVENAGVKIDGDVTAMVAGSNPYSKYKAPDFSGAILDDVVSSGGASDGHPGYTRVPVFYLQLQNMADCSGLKDVATGQDATSIAPPYTVQGGTFSNILPLPQLPTADGPTSVVVRVSDVAGNIKDYTQQLTYDTTPPTLSSTGEGVLRVGTSSVSSTLLVNLNFTGVEVSDNLYPSPGFWGVWVANSRAPVADPLTSGSLLWVPVQAPGASANFTVSNWSLAAGLPADQVTPGTYYVYVRFLDGAGNPSGAYVSAQTDLTVVSEPALYLPALSR